MPVIFFGTKERQSMAPTALTAFTAGVRAGLHARVKKQAAVFSRALEEAVAYLQARAHTLPHYLWCSCKRLLVLAHAAVKALLCMAQTCATLQGLLVFRACCNAKPRSAWRKLCKSTGLLVCRACRNARLLMVSTLR